MIACRAPGRAELLGNHTDYNEGFVLAFAVDRGTTVRGGPRPDNRVVLNSENLARTCETALDRIAPQTAEPWANYVLGVVHGFQARGASGPGFDLSISSDLPLGAGLSSSAALECSAARFLQRLWNTAFDDITLAKIGQAAEHGFAGVKCGLLDQITSLFGRDERVVAIDCRSLEVDLIPAPKGCVFILAQSGAYHALVTGEYNERRASCEAAAAALGVPFLRDATDAALDAARARLSSLHHRRARHITGENRRVAEARAALARGDNAALGRLMFESHESSRVNFENSCPELDFLVESARTAPGCLGARLSGGGFGGATLNLVEEPHAAAFQSHIAAAFQHRFQRPCAMLPTRAAGGPL